MLNNFFKCKNLNGKGLTLNNKRWKGIIPDECEKYNKYVEGISKSMENFNIINDYFLEKSNIKFNNYKNNIRQELEILNSNSIYPKKRYKLHGRRYRNILLGVSKSNEYDIDE